MGPHVSAACSNLLPRHRHYVSFRYSSQRTECHLLLARWLNRPNRSVMPKEQSPDRMKISWRFLGVPTECTTFPWIFLPVDGRPFIDWSFRWATICLVVQATLLYYSLIIPFLWSPANRKRVPLEVDCAELLQKPAIRDLLSRCCSRFYLVLAMTLSTWSKCSRDCIRNRCHPSSFANNSRIG